MNDYQNALLKMIDEIINFFDNNPELLKNPVIKKHVDNLRALHKELLANKLLQEIDIKGLFTRKKEVKNELAINNYRLTGSMRSFATDNNNNFLYQEIDTSKSDMKHLPDEDLLSYTQLIINKITEYQKDLESYGINAEELVNLTAMHKLFHELLLLPAEKRKEVKVATANIKQIVTKILNLLRESIDNDMLQYQDTMPELYKKYMVLREIDDSKTIALSIKGTVTSAHEPTHVLQYVRVNVKFHPGSELSGNVKTAATTTALGNYQFKGLPEGKCTITFEKNYYQTQTIESEIHPDKATVVDVEMIKTEEQ